MLSFSPTCKTATRKTLHCCGSSSRSSLLPINNRKCAINRKAGRQQSSTHAMADYQGWTLISFDVDGTLIRSVGANANKAHKDAFSAGFKDVFGIDTHIDTVSHHGSTDPLIVIKVMEYHGVDKEKVMAALPQVQAAMNSHFLSRADTAAEGIEILPGVQGLLQALQAHGRAATCLVTGNLEPIGWTKMKALGIHHLFTDPKFGGFGSDYCSGNTDEVWRDRAHLVKVASQKGLAGLQDNGGPSNGWKARYHIGDTPMDIQAALHDGAVAIGVTTGIFSADDLRAAAPSGAEQEGKLIIFENLADTQAVLRAMGLA